MDNNKIIILSNGPAPIDESLFQTAPAETTVAKTVSTEPVKTLESKEAESQWTITK